MRFLLLNALKTPETLVSLTETEWDWLIRAARVTRLLGRLSESAHKIGLEPNLPPPIRRRLKTARQIAAEKTQRMDWELTWLERCLQPLQVPVILLKGAAYRRGALPCQTGRESNDIDLLLDKTHLPFAEKALLDARYVWKELLPRDQKYFRDWLHELPPLFHRYRKLEVDVHHAVLPLTDTLVFPTNRLIANCRPLPSGPFSLLAPADMALHSACHLFRNGRYQHALRDLHDLSLLCEHFVQESPAFWQDLADRAHDFHAQEPTFLGLSAIRTYFGASVPDQILKTLQPPGFLRARVAMIQKLLDAAIIPPDTDNISVKRRLAITALAHYPLPRWRTMCSANFWLKRLGGD